VLIRDLEAKGNSTAARLAEEGRATGARLGREARGLLEEVNRTW